MGPVGSGPIHLAISCPHSGSGITGGLGSGLGGMRRWTEDSGTAVRTQVQDSVGTRGLTETLEIIPPTHWSQTVTRAPDIGGKLTSTDAFVQSHSRRVPMPLSLLLMDPKELEMPSLVAQDHSRLNCVSNTRSLWHRRKITRAPDSRPERNITALKQR